MTSSDAVVVVGAGISGIACARRLDAAGLPVVVLDRGRRPGGRMASRTMHGRVVDLGAQYVTASDPAFQAVVDGWSAKGIARPWTDSFHTGDGRTLGPPKQGPVRWAAPGGIRALVEDLARGLDVRSGRTVSSVRLEAGGVRVDGEPVRALALAMPDPQAARLLERRDAALAAALDHTWSPALALAAGWHERSWDVDGVFVDEGTDGTLSWIADDGRRRGDGAAVLVAHSTAELARTHAGAPEDGRPAMLAALRRQLGIDREPRWTYVRRWGLAKPTAPRDEPYRLLDPAGVLGVCGDGWSTTPKVQAAWLSGDGLGSALAERLA